MLRDLGPRLWTTAEALVWVSEGLVQLRCGWLVEERSMTRDSMTREVTSYVEGSVMCEL